MNEYGRVHFIALILITLTMFAWESMGHVRPWTDRRVKRWLYHGSVTIVNSIMTRVLFVSATAAWIMYIHDNGWGLSNLLGLKGGLEIALTVILYDGLNYGWHRMLHEVPFLWRFHKYHHTDTQVDVTTALRFQPGELALSFIVKLGFVLIWGPTLLAYFVFEGLITAYALFHHSNVDLPDRWEMRLRWIHMTPRLHAAHHTVSIRSRDGNYSTIFLIWDKIFGSFREADREELKSLGLAEGRDSHLSWKAYLLSPFKRLD
jgi:sterol desaturase/sphingolipid hydroxylase (fatty acid hydroxylase superfamily)